MRILGLDYGKKRIGIAISDENQNQAFPYLTLENRDRGFVFDKIKMIIEKEKVDKIVIGLPLTLKGEKKEAALEVQEFTSQLKKYLNLPIEFEDERLSTKMVTTLFKETPRKIKKKINLDEKAAVLILQSFLDRIRKDIIN